MFKLYSQRIKDAQGEPEILIYDKFPESFRNQCFYIFSDAIDELDRRFAGTAWDYIYENFIREKGFKCLVPNVHPSGIQLERFISNSDTIDFLDLLDFIINFLYRLWCTSEVDDEKAIFEKAFSEFDLRFKQHSLGYEITNGEIIRIDHKVIHQEIVKPALKLLYDEGFEGADEEYRKAHEFYKNGDNKSSILEAGKAFESTMKTICEKMDYTYNVKDTASKLVSHLKENGFYPSYHQEHLNHVAKTLESGAPTLRNKNSGHGQGPTSIDIPDHYAQYALNLAATNIVFLVSLYQAQKSS